MTARFLGIRTLAETVLCPACTHRLSREGRIIWSDAEDLPPNVRCDRCRVDLRTGEKPNDNKPNKP